MNQKVVYIPYRQKLDELCDFVFQTAKVLLNKGYTVKFIPHQYPYFFGNIYKEKYFVDAYKNLLKHPKFKVIRPFINIIPKKGTRRIFKLNQDALNFYLSTSIRKDNAILWTFWPDDVHLVKAIKQKSPETICIYDCVDNYTSVDNKIELYIRKFEKEIIKNCDFVFVNSHSLYKIKKHFRKDIIQVPLGFDYSNFQKARKIKKKNNSLFKNIPRPIVGYCGFFSYRIDYKLLLNTIQQLPNISFVFIGGIQIYDDDPNTIKVRRLIEKLKNQPNIYIVPKITNKVKTAQAIRNFNVGIIPYDISYDFNKFCYPMKLFEYFYVGIPVVSTPIEELKNFPKFVKIGNTASTWIKYIKTLSKKPWPTKNINEQILIAEANSWDKKVNCILNSIYS